MSYKLGVIGGMGPKASSYFIARLYGKLKGKDDSEHPEIIALSMSSIEDRTKALLDKQYTLLNDGLTKYINSLDTLGVTEIIIPCFTMHAIMRASRNQNKKIVMLDSILLEIIERKNKRALLLCTKGSYKVGLFQLTGKREMLVVPDTSDIDTIHQLIYSIKKDGVTKESYIYIKKVALKYSVEAIAFGCTELHMLHSHKNQLQQWDIIDPLEEISDLFSYTDIKHFHTGHISIKKHFRTINNNLA
jgi:aspartate racemase